MTRAIFFRNCIYKMLMLLNFKLNFNNLLYPFWAITSRSFYLKVLFKMRGVGFYYLLAICAVIAIPAGFKVGAVLEHLKAMELSSLVSKIPPSYLDANGVLTPKDNAPSFVEIKNSRGEPIIIYNPDNAVLDNEDANAPIELRSNSVIFKAGGQQNAVLYSSIFSTNSNFEPYDAASALDAAFNSSAFTVWALISVWFFAILSFNALIIAVIGRFVLLLINKVKVNFASMLRVASYANTIVAIILLLQYFISIPLSFTMIAFIPLVYIYFLGKDIRSTVTQYGSTAFKTKAQPNDFSTSNTEDKNKGSTQDSNHHDGTFTP